MWEVATGTTFCVPVACLNTESDRKECSIQFPTSSSNTVDVCMWESATVKMSRVPDACLNMESDRKECACRCRQQRQERWPWRAWQRVLLSWPTMGRPSCSLPPQLSPSSWSARQQVWHHPSHSESFFTVSRYRRVDVYFHV